MRKIFNYIKSIINLRVVGCIGFTLLVCLISCGKHDFGNNIATPVTTVSALEIASSDTVFLLQGKDSLLSYSIAPDSATNSALKWLTTDSSIATVDNGKVHAVGLGSASITANSTDGTLKKASVVVTVIDHIEKITSIEFTNVPADTALYEQDTLTIKAVVAPGNATYKALNWISSDTKIATVSDKGLVKAVAKGDVVIQGVANDGSGVKATLNLHVVEVVPVQQVDINTTFNDPLGLNQTVKLAYTVQPANATKNTLIWSSSDPTVVSVTQDGTITAIKEGTVTVSVKSKFDNQVISSVVLTVEAGKLDDVFTANSTPWITSTGGAKAEIKSGQFVVTMTLSGTKYRGDFQRKGGATVSAGKYPIVAFKMTRPAGAAGGANLTFDTNLGAFGNGANKFSTETAADGTTVFYYNIATGTFGSDNKLSTSAPTTLTTFQLKVADLVLTDAEAQAGKNIYHVDWVKSFSSLEAMEAFINQ